jgi:hypothetical protein
VRRKEPEAEEPSRKSPAPPRARLGPKPKALSPRGRLKIRPRCFSATILGADSAINPISFHSWVRNRVAIMILADNLPILRCPSCGGSMKLVRTAPRLRGLPDLLVVVCSSCTEVDVKEVNRAA